MEKEKTSQTPSPPPSPSSGWLGEGDFFPVLTEAFLDGTIGCDASQRLTKSEVEEMQDSWGIHLGNIQKSRYVLRVQLLDI